MSWCCVQVHLLFKHREAGICCCRLLPLFLAYGLKAALEVLFLLVKCFSPAFHVFGNLNIKFKCEHLQLNWNNVKGYNELYSISFENKYHDTCWAVLLLGFSFFSLGSLGSLPLAVALSFGPALFSVGAGTYVCFSLSQYRYCWVWGL